MTMTAPSSVTPRPLRRFTRSGLGDELLAGRAATGDDAAFTALYERYYGPLLGYTRSILLDGEDARDATQNALESALRALPARDASRPLRPWLYKIAHNEAITIVRRRRPQSELVESLEPAVPGPEFDAEQRGRLAQLVDDLRTLPERQRGALVMRELNGLSYDEIGVALGLSNEAARRAVFDARNALHDAVDGRATACASVRHSISDGDRRSLRARGIRAHLRSCDDCASFQRSIAARRADLHAFALWGSGAAIFGALGGGVGGGALIAGGGATAAGGAGLGWSGLPVAVKGLAVAAAVAGTGTAAVEIERVAAPDRPAPRAQTAQPPSSASQVTAPRVTATEPPRRVRAKAVTSGGAGAAAILGTSSDAPALREPGGSTAEEPAAALERRAPAASRSAPTAPAATPEELAKARIARLTERLRQVIADAQALAAGGTQNAMSMATSMLQRTVVPLLTSIDRVLARFGLRLPSSATASATAGETGLAKLLAPVRGILDSVQQMLQRMFSRG
ncbi:MAG TPA: sigma-70 family RNA polymerase sigma factor [Solirubrobacteraceae bacterium]|nr:sigma-70 family RNA polymerase sigma factor [Solirubrobacteraceae bacterium]